MDYDVALNLYRSLVLLASMCGATMATCDATKVSHGLRDAIVSKAWSASRKHDPAISQSLVTHARTL